MASEMIFEYFFANLAFRFPWQSIKFWVLDKTDMSGRGLLKDYFCSEIAINANFHFSHCKSTET